MEGEGGERRTEEGGGGGEAGRGEGLAAARGDDKGIVAAEKGGDPRTVVGLHGTVGFGAGTRIAAVGAVVVAAAAVEGWWLLGAVVGRRPWRRRRSREAADPLQR